jgi:hypothetical protein
MYSIEDIENAFNSGRGYGDPKETKDFQSFINAINKAKREKHITPTEWMYEQLQQHLLTHGDISKKVLSIHFNKAKEMEKGKMKLIYECVLQNVGTCVKQSDLPTFDEYYQSIYGK